MNREEYMKQREVLMTEAKELLANKDLEGSKKKAEEVKKLDQEFEDFAKEQANLNALNDVRPMVMKVPNEPTSDLETIGKMNFSGEDRKKDSTHEAINAYLHSKGAERTNLVSTDVEVTIPEEIIYNPENEVKSVTDLAQYVQVFEVESASGKYPILKRATAKLATVEELAKNPELAKPEFTEVKWEVKTYRGAIPISNEAIQDSAIDLVGLVARNALEQKVNTTNDAISSILKTFTAKTVSGESVDDIKHIINVDLDTAYNKAIVASQSFYQFLDTLKDKNGQYLLHQPITDKSPSMLLGLPVYVVEDELLGAAGEAHAFVGDLNRAVVMANRLDIQVRWVDDTVFGQFLQAALRFGAFKADEKAGYFLTKGDSPKP